MSLQIISTLFVVFVPLIVLFLKKKKNITKNLPPGPAGLPIIGNLHQLGPLPHATFNRLSKKYGPIFSLKLGTVQTVVASSPDTVRQLLKTYDLNCCTRLSLSGPGRLNYNYSDLAFSPYDEYWRELRKICTLELFSTKRVQSFRYIRREEIALFIDSVNECALTETPFNFGEKIFTLAGSVICRVGFRIGLQGSSIFNDKYVELLGGAMKVLGTFAAVDFLPYVGWIVDRVTGVHARREKVFRALDTFYDDVINQHVENKKQESGDDIIDVLLRIEKEQSEMAGFRLTRNHMKGILMNILIAGIDTSAMTIEWIMTRLIANPRVLKKVQKEIRERITDKDNISEEDIEKLDYLNMVIKESFRLHPVPALLIPRETISDMKINGYDIPAKTRVEINMWAIGRDSTLWKDTDEFIPERFLDIDIDYRGQHYEMLPFGGGRRICPGMNMGLALVYMTMINVLYRFDWKLPEGMTEKDVSFAEKFAIGIGKKTPLEVVPVRTQWT